jgi:catechol 2,3-dioxygenase-like lactoylglutathione lyase family enzyme
MKASLYHVQLNVSDVARSMPFYRALFEYLEYRIMVAQPDAMGVSDGTTDIWIIGVAPEYRARGFHRKETGVNHLAFHVSAPGDVDRFHGEFLLTRNLPVLYGGPREYPEYALGYYAVFFEDPDRIKLEVAHVPARSNAP